MADDFGQSVSRTLSTIDKQFSNVVWQQGKPPLDSELNLVGQIGWEGISESIKEQMHSGFLSDPLQSDKDYIYNRSGSNYFELKPSVAVVNGWIIPVSGTNKASEENAIKLSPPPTEDARTDFVFLEVWRTLLSANDATNKPSQDKVWKYGNVLYGGADNPSDEMIDGFVQFETTKRVQVQHRIRVVSAIDVGTYTEGLGSPNVLAQGTANSPQVGFSFESMSSQGDKGLWRAGDGDPTNSLNTVDGYVYAIPIACVFRRNSAEYVAMSGGGGQEHNGSVTRTPDSQSTSDARLLTTLTLNQDLTATAVGAVSVLNLNGSGFDEAGLFTSNRYIVIGEGLDLEIIEISSAANAQINIVSRGRGATMAKAHYSGEAIRLYNRRPDGRYADEVTLEDVMDMRHCVSAGERDYNRLLQSTVNDVLFNRLRTSFKITESSSKGTTVETVSLLGSQQAPVGLAQDAPDGIRKLWSDSSFIQRDLTLLLDPQNTALANDGTTSTKLNSLVLNEWTIAPDFYPDGFLYNDKAYKYGTSFFVKSRGDSGIDGVLKGIQNPSNSLPNRFTRFLHPREMRGVTQADQYPVKLSLFSGVGSIAYEYITDGADGTLESSMTTASQTYNQLCGLSKAKKYIIDSHHRSNFFLAPSEEFDYGDNLVVLGSVIEEVSGISTVQADGAIRQYTYTDESGSHTVYAIRLGVLIDDAYAQSPQLDNQTNFYNLLTDDGRDLTGQSSELYLHLYGDPVNVENNGVFKVIGAGELTPFSKYHNTDLGLVGVNQYVFCEKIADNSTTRASNFVFGTGSELKATIRVQSTDPRDVDMAVIITADIDRPVEKSVLSLSLIYPAGYGATYQVADRYNQIRITDAGSQYLRNNLGQLESDADLNSLNTSSSAEIVLPTNNHISTNAEIDLQGHNFTSLSTYTRKEGSETPRTSEAFFDTGSRSLMLCPFQRQNMTLENTVYISSVSFANNALTQSTGSALDNQTYLNGNPIDPALFFTAGQSSVYTVPFEAMPKFGRQDIPYHTAQTGGLFLSGLNHLFIDTGNNGDDVYNIVGGETNNGSNNVYPTLFTTSAGTYGDIVFNIANQEGLIARKTIISSERYISSDFPNAVNGIEIPPCLGFARVYGVYEVADFNANAQGARGAHQADRQTPINNGPVNLLRTDASQFTMYIREDGAELSSGFAPTYILTENAIDLKRIPGFQQGQGWSDYEYVIEAVVFGFSTGFIKENNFVLTRRYDGLGNALNDANPQYDSEAAALPNGHLNNVEMVFPSAIKYGQEVYISQQRTVYQGDPFHTHGAGNVPNYADSFRVTGIVDPDSLYAGQIKRSYLDGNGDSAIDLVNYRSLEVLASMDFITTYGTGKISGDSVKGSFMDAGFTDYDGILSSRIPTVSGTRRPQVKYGLFSEALRGEKASASVVFPTSKYELLSGQTSSQRYGDTGVLKINLVDPLRSISRDFYLDSHTHMIGDGQVYDPTQDYDDLVQFAEQINNSGSGVSVSVLQTPTTFVLFFESERVLGGNEQVTIEASWTSISANKGEPLPESATMINVYEGRRTEFGFTNRTKARLVGQSVRTNAGQGSVPSNLAGMISRLPLGLNVYDHDFYCEDPIENRKGLFSSINGQSASLLDSEVPVNTEGLTYDRVVGSSGEVLGMVDGRTLTFTPFTIDNPQGTKQFRTSRGGGAVYGVSGDVPGGPMTWLSETFPRLSQPVLKGALLACRAMLVRNGQETAYTGASTSIRSRGDELQVVICTYAVLSENQADLFAGGSISPSGFGEPLSASDRYRIKGRPLVKSSTSLEIAAPVPAPSFKIR